MSPQLMFLCMVGPFTFFNMQKTKYLQIFTTLMRWIAFVSMILLCALALGQGKGQGHPAMAVPTGLPNLFGVCVYSFMCHHSLPSLVTPWREKRHLFPLLAADYTLILGFYTLLSFTGIFTFPELHDIYKAILLLVLGKTKESSQQGSRSRSLTSSGSSNQSNTAPPPQSCNQVLVERFFFPLLALLPPIAVALATESVEFLVGFTGSYAGAFIQYIIPVALVHQGKEAVACVTLVTVNHIIIRA
ncbi:hypothetical protein MRX96_042520 [Rhipicephalus microplus]